MVSHYKDREDKFPLNKEHELFDQVPNHPFVRGNHNRPLHAHQHFHLKQYDAHKQQLLEWTHAASKRVYLLQNYMSSSIHSP